jgi:hypothetical protein
LARPRYGVPPIAAAATTQIHKAAILFQAERRNMDDEQPSQTTPQSLARKEREPAKTSQCIDWYAEGESRIVEINGIRVAVRFVGRKGRRCRIAILGPPGVVFFPLERDPLGDTAEDVC